MNKAKHKKLILGIMLSAIIYLGIGLMFAYSDHISRKSIFICDLIPNIDKGSAINSSDTFARDNVELDRCKQRSQDWNSADITTFATLTILWLPLLLGQMFSSS